ncbi:MAG: hypothetical protein J3R72DRAFT_442858 [Linnemannia gamsii]|nr:MAG: hypothetical protein J3R72DRAFT_442858 [Linnemannia gamsii]
MTETETTTAVQGEDGVETIVVEDTMTFTDGPEVDASSLHSLTTATKPVGEGESVVVEQAPEVVIAATSASGPGDAKPSVDESVETPLPSLSSTTVNTAATPASESAEVVEPSTPVPGRVQQPLQDVVALLPQGTTTTVAGDAKPTADLSVATTVLTPLVEVKSTLPAHLAPDAAPAALTLTTVAPTTMEKGEKTEKSEKRKSFWKKIKKVLA